MQLPRPGRAAAAGRPAPRPSAARQHPPSSRAATARRIAAAQRIAASAPARRPPARNASRQPDAIEPVAGSRPCSRNRAADQRPRRRRPRAALMRPDTASAGRSPADTARRESSPRCRTAPRRSRSSCRTPRSARPASPAATANARRRRSVTVAPADARDRARPARHSPRRTSAAARRHRRPPPARPHRASPPRPPPPTTRANRRRPAIATRQRRSPSSARHSGEVSSTTGRVQRRAAPAQLGGERAVAASRPRRSSPRPARTRRAGSVQSTANSGTRAPSQRPASRSASPIAALRQRARDVHRVRLQPVRRARSPTASSPARAR